MGLLGDFCNFVLGRPQESDVQRERDRGNAEKQRNRHEYQSTMTSYSNTESYYERLTEQARKEYHDAVKWNFERERQLKTKLNEQKEANRRIIAKLEEEGERAVKKIAGEKKEEQEKVRRHFEEQIQRTKECHAKEIEETEKEIKDERENFKAKQQKIENNIESIQQERTDNARQFNQQHVMNMEKDDEEFKIDQSNRSQLVLEAINEQHELKLRSNQIDIEKQEFLRNAMVAQILQENEKEMFKLILEADRSVKDYQKSLTAVKKYQSDPDSLKSAVSEMADKQAMMTQHIQNLRLESRSNGDMPRPLFELIDKFLDQIDHAQSFGFTLCNEMRRAVLGKNSVEKIAQLMERVDQLELMFEETKQNTRAIEN